MPIPLALRHGFAELAFLSAPFAPRHAVAVDYDIQAWSRMRRISAGDAVRRDYYAHGAQPNLAAKLPETCGRSYCRCGPAALSCLSNRGVDLRDPPIKVGHIRCRNLSPGGNMRRVIGNLRLTGNRVVNVRPRQVAKRADDIQRHEHDDERDDRALQPP
jgi:hypothetical protein